MNAVELIKYAHSTVLDAVEGLDEADAQIAGACGFWSVKDILAHLTSYEIVLFEGLSQLYDPELATPTLDHWLANPQLFNDIQVGQRQTVALKAVVSEYREQFSQNLDFVRKIPLEGLRADGALDWYGADYDIEDMLMYQYFGHKIEHSSQIVAFREREKLSVR